MKHLIPVLLTLAVNVISLHAHETVKPDQYVLISFDGAHDLAQWERSRRLAERAGARFTYFLSCTFLLSHETAAEYSGPGKAAGRSETGFARSRDEIGERLQQIWAARNEGHEIASHGCGHFNGSDWDVSAWRHEHAEFSRILGGAWDLNGIPLEPEDWQAFVANEINGFRAPYLAANRSMFEALATEGFLYDASAVSRGPAAPQAENGLYRFALPLIEEGPAARRIIAMDYNLFVRHSGGIERARDAAEFSERTYRAFMAALESEMAGSRRPLQLGFHFTLMNGGAYWDALERFASEACRKPQVRCVSHRDYLDQVESAAGETGSG